MFRQDFFFNIYNIYCTMNHDVMTGKANLNEDFDFEGH